MERRLDADDLDLRRRLSRRQRPNFTTLSVAIRLIKGDAPQNPVGVFRLGLTDTSVSLRHARTTCCIPECRECPEDVAPRPRVGVPDIGPRPPRSGEHQCEHHI
jgi:hypothetical protein